MNALLENPVWVAAICIYCAMLADMEYSKDHPFRGGFFLMLASINLFSLFHKTAAVLL